MNRTFFFIISCFSSLLLGCTVGPNYKKPTIPIPEKWDNTLQTPTLPSALCIEDTQWWSYFNDPLLKSIIEEAIGGNFDLQVAMARIRQARANLTIAQSGVMPAIVGVAGYTHSHPSLNANQNNISNSVTNSATSSNNRSSSNNDLFKLGFDVSWEMDVFGGIRRAAESQEALLQGAVENSRAVFLSVVSQIAQSYVLYRNTQNQVNLQQDIVNTFQAIYLCQKDLLQSGFVSELDVASALTSLTVSQAQLSALDTTLKTTLYDLGVLTGKSPTALLEQLKTTKNVPVMDMITLSYLPSTLIQNRPDIQKAERDLASATANIGVSVAQLFPVFDLTGLFTLNSSVINNLLKPSSSYVSAGPGITLPIFSFGKIQSQIDLQEALQEESLVVYKQSIMTALKEVETALVNLNNTQSQLKRELEHKNSLAPQLLFT